MTMGWRLGRMAKPDGNKASGRPVACLALRDVADPVSDSHGVDADLAREVSDREPWPLELANEVVDLGLGPEPAGQVMAWNG